MNDDKKTYNITKLDEDTDRTKTFYKERWINEDGFEQKLIVTYSIKYRNYQRQTRNAQVNRAIKVIDTNPTKLKKSNTNDYKRFIDTTNVTPGGEVADKKLYSIDSELISKEELFDGFYAVCTNLADAAPAIIKINHRRWEIEECYRIMKSEFKARPVYLSRDDRIEAHFTTCFLSMVIYRFLEKKLGGKFTTSEIIHGLRDMNFYAIPGDGYIPAYTRTNFTDALHETFGFRTDYQIVSSSQMKKKFRDSKK